MKLRVSILILLITFLSYSPNKFSIKSADGILNFEVSPETIIISLANEVVQPCWRIMIHDKDEHYPVTCSIRIDQYQSEEEYKKSYFIHNLLIINKLFTENDKLLENSKYFLFPYFIFDVKFGQDKPNDYDEEYMTKAIVYPNLEYLTKQKNIPNRKEKLKNLILENLKNKKLVLEDLQMKKKLVYRFLGILKKLHQHGISHNNLTVKSLVFSPLNKLALVGFKYACFTKDQYDKNHITSLKNNSCPCCVTLKMHISNHNFNIKTLSSKKKKFLRYNKFLGIIKNWKEGALSQKYFEMQFQDKGRFVDDIWSFAVVILEVFTGDSLFGKKKIFQKVVSKLDKNHSVFEIIPFSIFENIFSKDIDKVKTIEEISKELKDFEKLSDEANDDFYELYQENKNAKLKEHFQYLKDCIKAKQNDTVDCDICSVNTNLRKMYNFECGTDENDHQMCEECFSKYKKKICPICRGNLNDPKPLEVKLGLVKDMNPAIILAQKENKILKK